MCNMNGFLAMTPDTIRERNTAVEFTFATSLTVKLIVKRKNGCGFADGGVDTVSKKLVVVEAANTALQLLGKYEGVNQSSPNDKFVIELVYDTRLFRYYIQNLPKGCTRDRTTAYGSLWGFDYKYFDVGDRFIEAQKDCPPIVDAGLFIHTCKSSE